MNIFVLFLRISLRVLPLRIKPKFFIISFQLTFRARIKFKLIKDHSANGEIRNILPAILEIIDITHDRFLSGKHGGKKHTSSVKKKVLSRSSQVKTSINSYYNLCLCCEFIN